MNLTEKIFAMHNVDAKGFLQPGDTIRVSVDWIMASEASWGVSSTRSSHICTMSYSKSRVWRERMTNSANQESSVMIGSGWPETMLSIRG